MNGQGCCQYFRIQVLTLERLMIFTPLKNTSCQFLVSQSI